jgi:excisionase family DNA binding protein
MPTEKIDKILLKVPEVCKVTGYSRSFIYQAIRDGSLRVTRKGRTVRIRSEDLQTWIGTED